VNPESDASNGGVRERHVACPKCEHGFNVPVTVSLRPDEPALQQLVSGRLNRVTCPECETEFLVNDPIVFRDDEKRFLVFFLPVEDTQNWRDAERQMTELAQSLFGADLPAVGAEFRLALTRRAFIEKIYLHAQDLDDRLVEYVKYQLQQRDGEKLDPIRKELLYDFSNADPNRLAFIVFDRESGRAAAGAYIPMDVYRELAETFFEPESQLQRELKQLFPGYYVSVDRLQ